MASFRVMMAHLVYLETLESSVVLVVKVSVNIQSACL